MAEVRGQIRHIYRLILKEGYNIKSITNYNVDEYVVYLGKPDSAFILYTVHLMSNELWQLAEGRRKCRKN